MWVEDVSARGGLLGRPVELVAYDDHGSPAAPPAIYAKLLEVDRVDLLIAPYGTAATAPLMPMVKSRGKLLMGDFSVQVNHVMKHDLWLLPARKITAGKTAGAPGAGSVAPSWPR